MKTSNSYSSGGNNGTRRKKCNRNRINNKRSNNQEPGESEFLSQIARMEHRVKAQAETARLRFYKHQAAWWKSQFVATQFENRMLRQLLDQHYQIPNTLSPPKQFSSYYATQASFNKLSDPPSSSEVQYEDKEDSDIENGEFELSEEFKQFLDINRLHREERDKEKARKRKERGSETETELVVRMEKVPTDTSETARRKQLRQLYGERWRQVEGLETHTRMQHDQFCDRHQPIYWPNIPLNL